MAHPDDMMRMKPIGYLRSVFQYKNGTPRQPSLCVAARGSLTVDKSVFNNPEHALEGLEQFSHAWILFLFHKNRPGHTKAKVKPPRLNGKRVGVFSTRSPYRPNAIGLTLARIERIAGATVHLLGIDIVDGTPVLDIKPFIPQYDNPACRGESPVEDSFCADSDEKRVLNVCTESADSDVLNISGVSCDAQVCTVGQESLGPVTKSEKLEECSAIAEEEKGCTVNVGGDNAGDEGDGGQTSKTAKKYDQIGTLENQGPQAEGLMSAEGCTARDDSTVPSHCGSPYGSEGKKRRELIASQLDHGGEEKGENCCEGVKGNFSPSEQEKSSASLPHPPTRSRDSNPMDTTVAQWLVAPPVTKLHVSFTPTAEAQLRKFRAGNSSDTDDQYTLEFLSGIDDVRRAVVSVLAEDPRSVYRREKCSDSLYFFTVDRVHVTCWFDDKENRVEVVRLQPVPFVEKLLVKER